MKTLTTLATTALLVVGCQSETPRSTDASVDTTPATFNSEGAPTAELHVPNMYCQHACVAKVKEILASQEGVKDVKIDFDTKTATLAISKAAFNAEAALAALVDHQFNDSKLITTAQK